MLVRTVMATGSPMMNGDIPHTANPPGTLEETLQLMNILIQENRDLKGENAWGFGFVRCRGNNLIYFHLSGLRSPASDQPVNEGTF